MDQWEVYARVRELETRYAEHQRRQWLVNTVRDNNLTAAYPELMAGSLEIDAAANFIDAAARDFAEMVAPLPSLNCASGVQTSETARRFAEKRKLIGWHYWQQSNFVVNMATAADNYQSAGVAYFLVEPDHERKMPKARLVNPYGTYPDFDLERNVVGLGRKWIVRTAVLAAQYPQYADQILQAKDRQTDNGFRTVTVYKWVDADQHLMWIQDYDLILDRYPNRLGVCPVVAVTRPPGPQLKGAYDDLCGVQAARAYMLRLSVQNADQQVNAPLAVPNDTTDVPIGPLSLLHTDQPQNVRRVDLSIPPSTFTEIATLQNELLMGARTPQQRFGTQPGSIVTGQGVDALLGGYDSQVKQAQAQFAWGLEKVTGLCYRMDEVYWPNEKKQIYVTLDGAPYALSYTPSKDIAGDYTSEVSYGFVAGLDPNRAVVFMLQLLAAGVIPREVVQKSLPFDLDVTQMQTLVETEKLNDAALAGVASLVQAIGPMIEQGQDPTPILQLTSDVIKGAQKSSKPIATVIADAFTAMVQTQQAQQQAAAAGGSPTEADLAQQVQDAGSQSPYNQALTAGSGFQPGIRPAVQQLMAGIGNGGQANLSANLRQQLPAG